MKDYLHQSHKPARPLELPPLSEDDWYQRYTVRRMTRWYLVLAAVMLAVIVALLIFLFRARPLSQPAPQTILPRPSAVAVAPESPDPHICGLEVVECPGEVENASTGILASQGRLLYGTITTYQAVPEQTDGDNCSGAMAGIDFCNPPFPIVANDQLPFGTKVKIRGTLYTVADRFGAGKPITMFDVLTDGENYKLINEPIEIL